MLPTLNNRARDFPKFDLFDTLFNDLVLYKPSKSLTNYTPDTVLPVDIAEQENSYIITAELPGILKEDINITLEDNKLSVSINNVQEVKEETTKYIRREIKSTSKERVIQLPTNIVEKSVKAALKNGILCINIQKETEKQPARITIN